MPEVVEKLAVQIAVWKKKKKKKNCVELLLGLDAVTSTNLCCLLNSTKSMCPGQHITHIQ